MQLFHLMPLFHQHALQDWGSGLMRLHHPHALQGWAAGARARLLRRIGIRLKDAPEVYVKKVCLARRLAPGARGAPDFADLRAHC